MADRLELPTELIDALWHCQIVAENNDRSLGDHNFQRYDRVRRWLEEEVDYAD